MIEIHKSRDTDDIAKKVLQWLRIEFSYDGPDNDVEVYFRNDKLQLGKSLSDVGIIADANLRIVLPKINPIPDCQLVLEATNSAMVPKPPKETYKCEPAYETLR